MQQANRDVVIPRYIEMMAKGVREAGMGLFMDGGWESFGGSGGPLAWGDSSIGKLLSTEDVVGTWIEDGQPVIDRYENEFVSSIPWDLNLS